MLTSLLTALAFAASPVEIAGTLVTTLNEPPLSVVQLPDGTVRILTADHYIQRWENRTSGWELVEQTYDPYAMRLYLEGESLLVSRYVVETSVLGAGAPLTPTTEPQKPRASVGVALTSSPGGAVIDLGEADGLYVGASVRFLRPDESGRASLVGEGFVNEIEASQAVITLLRGSEVQAGDRVETTTDTNTRLKSYPLAPQRQAPLSELGAVLRPMLPVGDLGFAMVNEAWARRSFGAPAYAELRLSPLGFGVSTGGNVSGFAGSATGGYEGRWFSAGLGAGAARVRDPFAGQITTLLIAQSARLGSYDGLSLSIRSSFVLMPAYSNECYSYYYYDQVCEDPEPTGQEFGIGDVAMRLTVPLNTRSDLFADWDIPGQLGSMWITGGINTWLVGNGDPGSLGLEVSAGYASLESRRQNRSTQLNGPVVSVGMRWRPAGGEAAR